MEQSKRLSRALRGMRVAIVKYKTELGVHMKFVKKAGKMGAMAAAAVAIVIVLSGAPAYAWTYTWGEIRPYSGNGVPYSPSQCLALNAADGFYNDHTRVFQWECNGHDDQQWETQGVDTLDGNIALYQVVNKQSGKCMEITGNAYADGAQVDQITCSTAFRSLVPRAQLWAISYDSGGDVRFHQLRPAVAIINRWNKCLDIRGGFAINGTMVEEWTCNGGTNQKFFGDPLFGLS